MSQLIKEFAVIMLPFPKLTPFPIVQFEAIQTSSAIKTGASVFFCLTIGTSISWDP